MKKNVAEFMTKATGDYFSKLGISRKNDDFTTASEFSELFCSILGDWVIQAWEKNACPNPVQLVELGPGTGILMRRVLERIKEKSPELFTASRIVMFEHSKSLEEMQRQTLLESPKYKNAKWISEISDLPKLPFIMFANEFFDCLPIHQVVKTEKGFRERYVEGKKFTLGNDEPTYLLPYMAREHVKAMDESVIELCPYAYELVKNIAKRITSTRSTAIIIDYGYEEPQTTETLQAVRNGKFYPVLETNGDADITSHVDFSALRAAAIQGNASVYGPLKQGLWLKKMKIEKKANDLMKTATDDEKKKIHDSVEKLISFNKMGNNFKVMILHPKV